MIPKYTQEEFENSDSTDLLFLECEHCNKSFQRMKKDVKRSLLGTRADIKFCSIKCTNNNSTKKQSVTCNNCNVSFVKKFRHLKRSKSGNHFCSKSCAATYNNKNKTHGTRRSKLEVWLENQLTMLYPNLIIDYNQKNTIGSELDIYIPSLKLAFELNGIFHCEPVFGQRKLDQVLFNNINKFKACQDNNITLCIIDTSKQKYFKEHTSKEFLDIIIYHINWVNFLANLPK